MSELNLLQQLLLERPWILADGATGTRLLNMGLNSGTAPELWNDTNSEDVGKLYQKTIDSGVDLFLTNSFGSNYSRLKLHDAGHRSYELSQKAAEIARNLVDKSNRTIVIAGSIGPTGEILQPAGDLTFREAVEIFSAQVEGLKAGGVDVYWVETMSDPTELKAAGKAIKAINGDWCATMSFDTAGRTMMGFSASSMVSLIDELENPPLAIGANCGVGVSDLLRTLKEMTLSRKPLIAKGNAGIPKFKEGKIYYDGTLEVMADYACLARDLGVKIIGGCCGTTPQHLRAMRSSLESQPFGSTPTLEDIEKKLGNFSSISNLNTSAKLNLRRARKRRKKR